MPNFRTFTDGKAIYSVDMMLAYVNTHKHPITRVPIANLQAELEKPVWGKWSPKDVLEKPSLKKYAEDVKRIQAADLKYPILMTEKGEIVDGFHRVAKAVRQGNREIRAYVLDAVLMRKCIVDKDMNFVRVHQEMQVYDLLELFAKRFC